VAIDFNAKVVTLRRYDERFWPVISFARI